MAALLFPAIQPACLVISFSIQLHHRAKAAIQALSGCYTTSKGKSKLETMVYSKVVVSSGLVFFQSIIKRLRLSFSDLAILNSYKHKSGMIEVIAAIGNQTFIVTLDQLTS